MNSDVVIKQRGALCLADFSDVVVLPLSNSPSG